jgi:hypothetical protein
MTLHFNEAFSDRMIKKKVHCQINLLKERQQIKYRIFLKVWSLHMFFFFFSKKKTRTGFSAFPENGTIGN